PECPYRSRDRHPRAEVGPTPPVEPRLGHARDDVQAAGRATAHPGLALALEPDPRSILDTRRNPNRVALGAPLTPGAMALRARLLDHGAVAAATRARLREREEPLALGLDSAAVALGADDRGSSRLCAGAAPPRARAVP